MRLEDVSNKIKYQILKIKMAGKNAKIHCERMFISLSPCPFPFVTLSEAKSL
jgi:hypothetical protein